MREQPLHSMLDALNQSSFTGDTPAEANKPWTTNACVDNTGQPMSPVSCAQKCLVLLGLLLAFPGSVLGQTNGLGGGEQGLVQRRGDQVFPALAFGLNGGFVVCQDNVSDPFGLGVSLQRLNAGLQPEGPAVLVNQTTPLDQQRAKVAMLPDGGAMVVWQAGRPGAQNIFARVVGADGSFGTGEFLVNTPAGKSSSRMETNWTLIYNNKERTRRQIIKDTVQSRHDFNANPSVAVLMDGSAVVAWSSSRVANRKTVGLREWTTYKEKPDGTFTIINNRRAAPMTLRESTMQDVYVQRLSATGAKLGSEFRANHFTEFNQRDVALASLDSGGFVLAWVSENQRSNNAVDIYVRLFDAAGIGANEFLVSTGVVRMNGSPAITGTPGGGFTVAWTQRDAVRTNGMEVLARCFDANGVPASGTFKVNTFTYGDQFSPSIASLGSQQLIVWSSMGQDGSWEGVFARTFSGPLALSDEFRVNLSTAFAQKQPQVATDGAGRAFVLWSGYWPGGNSFDLWGRGYLAP